MIRFLQCSRAFSFLRHAHARQTASPSLRGSREAEAKRCAARRRRYVACRAHDDAVRTASPIDHQPPTEEALMRPARLALRARGALSVEEVFIPSHPFSIQFSACRKIWQDAAHAEGCPASSFAVCHFLPRHRDACLRPPPPRQAKEVERFHFRCHHARLIFTRCLSADIHASDEYTAICPSHTPERPQGDQRTASLYAAPSPRRRLPRGLPAQRHFTRRRCFRLLPAAGAKMFC